MVAFFLGYICCLGQSLVGVAVQIGFTATHAGLTLEFAVHNLLQGIAVDAHLPEKELCDVFPHLQDTCQEVYSRNSLLPAALCTVDSLLYGFLCFNCEIIEVHKFFIFIILPYNKTKAAPNGIRVTFCQ